MLAARTVWMRESVMGAIDLYLSRAKVIERDVKGNK